MEPYLSRGRGDSQLLLRILTSRFRPIRQPFSLFLANLSYSPSSVQNQRPIFRDLSLPVRAASLLQRFSITRWKTLEDQSAAHSDLDFNQVFLHCGWRQLNTQPRRRRQSDASFGGWLKPIRGNFTCQRGR